MKNRQAHYMPPKNAKNAIVSIGNFDGVHTGHQAIIKRLALEAKAKRTTVGVITFDPHPLAVIRPEFPPFRITNSVQREEHLKACGADWVWEIPFDESMQKCSPQNFVADFISNVAPQRIVVGKDFIFGYQRSGTVALLEELCGPLGISVSTIDDIRAGKYRCSSTRIREAIASGKMSAASKLLGRPFTIEAVVEEGRKKARELGFPTANLSLGNYIRPPYGVYAARVLLAGARKDAIVNIGVRPTWGVLQECCEVHIFDFDKNLYGKKIAVELLNYLRTEKKFSTPELLQAQISEDCIKAKKWLKTHK
jgi:riboflavin kinase/FMN adenylyltransferase